MENEIDRLTEIGGHVFAALETVLSKSDFEKKDIDIKWVYIIKNKSTGLYKIGKSTNLKQRIKTISMHSGVEIDIICAAYVETFNTDYSEVENLLHRFFKPKRVVGEWFTLSKEDILGIYEAFNCIDVDGIIEHTNFHDDYGLN